MGSLFENSLVRWFNHGFHPSFEHSVSYYGFIVGTKRVVLTILMILLFPVFCAPYGVDTSA